MLLTCKRDLASLCNRGFPNIEGDRVAQQASSLQTAGQCMYTIALSLQEVLRISHITFTHKNNCSNNCNFLNTLPNEFLRQLVHENKYKLTRHA